METIKTGKDEHYKKFLEKMNRTLASQPDYIEGFYYNMMNSGKTPSYKTQEVYVNHVIHLFKVIPKTPEQITMDDVNKFLAKISIKPDGERVSGSYLVSVYSALKKFFRYMQSSKRIKEDPMENIDRPKPKKSNMVERTYLTKAEIKKVFRAIETTDSIWKERDKAIMMLFFSTGIRITCLTEINVSNIDFENNCIYIVDKGTKPKQCYLSDSKMDIIKEWLVVRERLLVDNTEPVEALFINRYKVRAGYMAITDIVKKYTEMIGHKITPHKARGSFATNALNSGLSLYEVSKLMNHSSPEITMECYIQGQDEKVKEAGLKATRYLDF